MPNRQILARSVAALAALFVTTALHAAPTVTGMQLVSEKRISRTVFDYTYKVTIQNDATARQDVVAQVAAVGGGTSILDGAVTVGALTANQQVAPADTITLRHDRLQPFSQAAITWTFTGTEAPQPPSGNPPQGILVPGEPTASLATAMPNYTAADGTVPLSQISTDPDTGNRVIRTALHVAFREDATVGEANAFLISINGRIAVSSARVGAVSVRIPDPGSLGALYALIDSLRTHPAVELVLPDVLMEAQALPSGSYALTDLDHHLAIRAGAAWNARQALNYPSSKRPVFVIYDIFGIGEPPFPDTQVVWAQNSFSTTCTLGNDEKGISKCADGHGYHVAGIVAGSFGGMGADEIVTGAYPSEAGKGTALQGYAIDQNLWQAGANERTAQILRFVQAEIEGGRIPSDRIVLNTSMERISPFPEDVSAFLYGRYWLRLLRDGQATFATPLEDRLLHAAAAGNKDGALARRGIAWNAAALYDLSTLGIEPARSTLVVENRMVIPEQDAASPGMPGCLHSSSNIEGNISAIGSRFDSGQPGVMSFFLPGFNPVAYVGTSMAAPQVAGLAAYLWTLRPSLTGPQVADRIKANSRTASCPGGDTSATPVIDAYATILSADEGLVGKHPARLAILDVHPVAGGEPKFDELDIDDFLDAFSNPNAGTFPDYSRYDLNGDGFTGGTKRDRFNLDISYDEHGASTYNLVPSANNGLTRQFDEEKVTDLDILCYYAYSPLYSGTDVERSSKLGALCRGVSGVCSELLPIAYSSEGILRRKSTCLSGLNPGTESVETMYFGVNEVHRNAGQCLVSPSGSGGFKGIFESNYSANGAQGRVSYKAVNDVTFNINGIGQLTIPLGIKWQAVFYPDGKVKYDYYDYNFNSLPNFGACTYEVHFEGNNLHQIPDGNLIFRMEEWGPPASGSFSTFD